VQQEAPFWLLLLLLVPSLMVPSFVLDAWRKVTLTLTLTLTLTSNL